MKKIFFYTVFAAAFLLTGCAVENNHLSPADFADCLRRNDIRIEASRPLSPDPFRASSGHAFQIGDTEIQVYKFDVSSSVQRKRLDGIADSRKVYVIGIPFYAVVHGSFVFVGLDKNKQKHEIMKAIKSFN